MEDSSMVATFVSITEAEPDIAQYYLEACNWELQAAVNTYLEHNQFPLEPQPHQDVDSLPYVDEERDIPYEPGLYAERIEDGDEENEEGFHTPDSLSPDRTDPIPTDPVPPPRDEDANDDFDDHYHTGFDDAFDLPDGFGRSDVEEQRMLMAALQDLPFTGDVDAILQRHPPPRAPSPGTLADRELRKQQDEEFEATARMDSERAREKIEKERLEREEAVMEARRRQDEVDSLTRALDIKRCAMPLEPPEDHPEAIVVVMRFPDGSRSRRRFRRTDPVSALFDFVDVDLSTIPSEGETPSWWKLGGYNLATQFPRRVIQETNTATLETVGLTDRQETLFVETK